MTDLNNIGAPKDTATMTLFHPETDEPLTDNDGNEMYIEVYGQDSGHYKQVQHAQANRRIQKAQRTGRMNFTAEQQEAQGLDLMAKCTRSWHIVLNGETPECNEANARSLYKDYPWIRDQVDAFMHDRKAFLTS